MKTTLPMRNELLVLGVLRGNPDIWFNELKKKTGLRPNTLTNVLKRLQDDNRISMKKQGIKSLYSSTDKGLIFLNKATRKQATYFTQQQLDRGSAIIAQNFVWKGEIFKWQCPNHQKQCLYYRLSDFGVAVRCDKDNCNQDIFFRLRSWPLWFTPVLKDKNITAWLNG
jgi:DNA-binding MarR family transcriptional regulator